VLVDSPVLGVSYFFINEVVDDPSLISIHRTFWHQVMRQRLCAPAQFFTYHILRLKENTLIARYVFLIAAFTISDLFHTLSDIGAGLEWKQIDAMRFFVTQALGIMFENGVQAMFRAMATQSRTVRHKVRRRWSKAIEYVWVMVWMTWTRSSWFYSKMYSQTGDEWDQLLPFSLLRRT
jgi:hypothetical protein